MKSNNYEIKALIITTVVALLFMIIAGYFVWDNSQINNYLTTIQNELDTKNKLLKSTQHELDTVQTNMQKTIQVEIEKSANLSNELDATKESLNSANEIISALKTEKYSVDHVATNREIEMIAQTIWGEARGLSTIEQSMVVWCILNRVDDGYWGDTIAEVIIYPNQFHGYNSSYPITDEFLALAQDVVTRWQMEKYCRGNVGRTLPCKYLYFHARDGHNVFKTNYTFPYEVYDWSDCYNPYS